MPKKRTKISGSVFLRSPKRDTWYFQVRLLDGTHTMRKIGLAWKGSGRPQAGYYTATTAREFFERALLTIETEIALERNMTRGVNPTFSIAADEYLDYLARHRGLRASTLRRYRSIIDKDLIPALGEMTLSEITKEEIRALFVHLSTRPRTLRGGREEDELTHLSASSLNQTRTILVGIFAFAKKGRGYPGEDPSREFEQSRVKPQSHIDVYDPAEVMALARAAKSKQDEAIFLTAAFAGLRRSELRALRWRDIDFAKSTIFVRAGYTDEGGHGLTKSGKGRSVPLIPQVAKVLDELSRRPDFTAPNALVFVNPVGGVIDGGYLYHRFVQATQDAGLRRLRFHDLRHVFGSLAVQAWPLSDVKAYMGHANINTTMIYVHHIPHTDAAAKLGALVERDSNPIGDLIGEAAEIDG